MWGAVTLRCFVHRVGAALEALRNAGYTRLRPIELRPVKGLAAFIAVYHLGDPFSRADGWRPWRRKALSESAMRQGREAMKSGRGVARER